MIGSLLFTLALCAGLCYLLLLWVWKAAGNEKGLFFTRMAEGTGTFIMDGEKAGKIIVVMQGHTCELVKEQKNTYGQDQSGNVVLIGTETVVREKIIEGTPRYSAGVLGWLERSYGIYWVGLPPKSRMKRKFKWSEQEHLDGVKTRLRRREEDTNFFYVQTFPYGLVLEGAETGSTLREGGHEVGGNIAVDIELDLFLCVVYPRVALFGNTDWFDQLAAVVLDHARLYVGKHAYDKLRSQAETPKDKPTHNEFSEYIMQLNKYASIGKDYASVIDALGVKIMGAQIRTVTLSDSRLAEATTAVYVAEQDKLAAQLKADGEAYGVRTVGQARADTLAQQASAVKAGGREGELVLNSQTLTELGKNGNTFVTNGNTPFILNTNGGSHATTTN